jgi:hypothetical protein
MPEAPLLLALGSYALNGDAHLASLKLRPELLLVGAHLSSVQLQECVQFGGVDELGSTAPPWGWGGG